jgi:DNA-directed RNA polymerase sigma subunit (sigma70/sigma32)
VISGASPPIGCAISPPRASLRLRGWPWTLEAIGHELDLTRERVRQLEAQALARLVALRDLAAVSSN